MGGGGFAAPCAKTEPVLGPVLLCESTSEAWEAAYRMGCVTGGEQRERGRGGKDEDSHGMGSHHAGEGKCAYFRTASSPESKFGGWPSFISSQSLQHTFTPHQRRRRIFFTTSELTGPAGRRQSGKGKGDF